MTIETRIKATRSEWGLTQQEFGKLAGVSKAAVSQWEHGVTKPERDALLSLQKKRKLSPNWVLTGHGDQYIDGNKHPNDDRVVPMPLTPPLDELLRVAKSMSKEGQHILLGRAQEIVSRYPVVKANPAKS